jgi:hypothetical protein
LIQDGGTITPEQIKSSARFQRGYKEYVDSQDGRTPERWRQEVHGAGILADLFSDLSGDRVEYLKVEFGVSLTDWLIANSPEELRVLCTFLSELLPIQGMRFRPLVDTCQQRFNAQCDGHG